MIFPEREIADEIAEDLLEEDDFTEVRVVRGTETTSYQVPR